MLTCKVVEFTLLDAMGRNIADTVSFILFLFTYTKETAQFCTCVELEIYFTFSESRTCPGIESYTF